MTKPTGKHLTRQQILEIGIVLQKTCKPASHGFYAYVEGYSDAKIAQEYNVSTAQVMKLRKDVLGDIHPDSTSNKNNPLLLAWGRIKELERRVDALEDAATKPRPNGLAIGTQPG